MSRGVLYDEARKYGLTMERAKKLANCKHRWFATELRPLWDYRTAGLKIGEANAWLHRVRAMTRVSVERNNRNERARARDALETRPQDRRRELFARREADARRAVPPRWCEEVEARYRPHEPPHGSRIYYEQRVEWKSPYKAGRRNWPSRRYDALCVRLCGVPGIEVSADSREIRVGPWTYRKGRGHSLAVRYEPQGAEHDTQAFLAEGNAERRAAIVTACGEALIDSLNLTFVQADDFGKLYDVRSNRDSLSVRAIGRFVRVVCPSTGRVYWLQVPPTTPSAHAAVAATFGLTVDEYQPIAQS